MNASEIQDALQAVIDQLLNARDRDDALGRVAEALDGVDRVRTYADAGLVTADAGLVLRARGGREFQVTIIRSR
ncbi:MAG: hypothetical protein AMXMBFR58_24630 [Phycisphaerae bacterium]